MAAGGTAAPVGYVVGVAKASTGVAGPAGERFDAVVDAAILAFEQTIAQSEIGLSARHFALLGTAATTGDDVPLALLHRAAAERLTRGVHFVLVVTDADLAPSRGAYALAFPSRITNVAIVSAARLDPIYWGEAREGDWAENQVAKETAAKRLVALLLHSLGHLLALPHISESANVMFDLLDVHDLDAMVEIDAPQLALMRNNVLTEARAHFFPGPRWVTSARGAVANWPPVGAALARAHPLRVAAALPRLPLGGLAATLVAVFALGALEAAAVVPALGVVLTSVVSLATGTWGLDRALAQHWPTSRAGDVAEPAAIARAAAFLSLALTIAVVYAILLALAFAGTLVLFPTQAGAGGASLAIKHAAVAAALATLVGATAAAADAPPAHLHALYFDEET